MDVKTAFLYGELEEEIYMECPQGMQDATKDDILLPTACIYGLVQAARQYYKKVVKILKEIGFTGGDVDPCLFCKRSDKVSVSLRCTWTTIYSLGILQQ